MRLWTETNQDWIREELQYITTEFQAILRSPDATSEEREIAESMLAEYTTLLGNAHAN